MTKRRFFILIGVALVVTLLLTFVQNSGTNNPSATVNSTQVAKSTIIAEMNKPTPTTDPAKAVEWSCKMVHHGQEFTVPYTAVEMPYAPEWAVDNAPVTKFTYSWKNLTWIMGATCLERPGPSAQDKWGPTYSTIKYDKVQAPESPKVDYSCNGTDVVVSGRTVANTSCTGNEIVMDELRLQFYFDNSPDNGDTHGSALRLRYLLHSDIEELSCRWFAESDNDVFKSMSFDGRESGYFSYENRDTEAVICAGTGFTVELHTK